MQSIVSGIFCTLFLILATGCGSGEKPDARFECQLTGPRKEGDSIDVIREGPATVFIISSEFGIGRATIQPLEGNWPGAVRFQLNLKALESFVVNGERLYRTERSDDGAKGGYEVDLPAGVTGSGKQPIEIEWVDFFRQ